MPRKLPPLDIDNLYLRYQTGEGVRPIAESVGIGATTLARIFKQAGHELRSPGRTRLPFDFDALYARYLAGDSADIIGASMGVDPPTLRRAFRDRGYILRSGSDAQQLRISRLTINQRQQYSAAAHDAVRGMKRSDEDLARRAAGKERNQSHIGESERDLAAMLERAGIPTVLAKAIGPYNIDVAAGAVAVECYGGGWHGGGAAAARFQKRTRYLVDAGWHVVIVWIDKRRHPLSIGAADYVVALLNETGRDPSPVRQYRVIRGTGQEIVRGCSQDDHFPLKPPRERRAHIRCGHHSIA